VLAACDLDTAGESSGNCLMSQVPFCVEEALVVPPSSSSYRPSSTTAKHRRTRPRQFPRTRLRST